VIYAERLSPFSRPSESLGEFDTLKPTPASGFSTDLTSMVVETLESPTSCGAAGLS
jgi:hypothetical protein